MASIAMDINQLLIDSLELLVLGMGAVFVILITLIAIITAVSRILPDEALPTPASSTEKPINEDHMAAITAAVKQYRKNR